MSQLRCMNNIIIILQQAQLVQVDLTCPGGIAISPLLLHGIDTWEWLIILLLEKIQFLLIFVSDEDLPCHAACKGRTGQNYIHKISTTAASKQKLSRLLKCEIFVMKSYVLTEKIVAVEELVTREGVEVYPIQFGHCIITKYYHTISWY